MQRGVQAAAPPGLAAAGAGALLPLPPQLHRVVKQPGIHTLHVLA